MKPLRIMKFGGTSLAGLKKIKIIARFLKKQSENYRQLVVVSAMGKETDELVKNAFEVSSSPSPRELDKLMHTGEIKSAAFLAMALNNIGVQAKSFSAHQMVIRATSDYGSARIESIGGVDDLRKELENGVIPICSGFQGMSRDREIVTLGRGGSDVVLVALTHALGEKHCIKFSDIDGIFTVDPNLVPGAKKFQQINHQQVINMSSVGSGALMERSVDLAQSAGVEINVRLSPSLGESDGGTLITNRINPHKLEGSLRGQVTLVVRDNLSYVGVSNIPDKEGQAELIFEAIGTNVNMEEIGQPYPDLLTNIAMIGILIDRKDYEIAMKNLGEKLPDSFIVNGKEKVHGLTLIDPNMQRPRYMLNVSRVLRKVGVNIVMILTSGIQSMLVVNEEDFKKAVLALAKEFELIESSS